MPPGRRLWLAAALAVLLAADARAQPCQASYDAAPPAEPRPDLAGDLDQVARAYGVPPLREVALDRGTREIRVWYFRGILMGSALLRVVEGPGSVCGELIRWWEHVDSLPVHTEEGAEAQQVSGHAAMRDPGCRRIRHGESIDWCRLKLAVPVRWPRVLFLLDSLSVMTLPDVRELGPPKLMIMDDLSVEVEVRGESGYRTYGYGGLVPPPSPEARKGRALIGLLRALYTLGRFERQKALEYLAPWWRERLAPDSAAPSSGPRRPGLEDGRTPSLVPDTRRSPGPNEPGDGDGPLRLRRVRELGPVHAEAGGIQGDGRREPEGRDARRRPLPGRPGRERDPGPWPDAAYADLILRPAHDVFP